MSLLCHLLALRLHKFLNLFVRQLAYLLNDTNSALYGCALSFR